VDTKNYRITALDHPDGLTIELPDRGTITLKKKDGGKVTVTAAPKPVLPVAEGPKPRRVTDPVALATFPNAADGLERSDLSKDALAYLGGGDPDNVPPELVAVLGDTRFRVSHPGGAMAYSPDGKQLAVANDTGEIRFFAAQTGRLLRHIRVRFYPIERLAFSPDGRYLVAEGPNEIFSGAIDVETGRRVWGPVPYRVHSFAFAPDGTGMYLLGTSGARLSLECREIATGNIIDRVPWGSLRHLLFVPQTGAFTFSADGDNLAVARGQAADRNSSIDVLIGIKSEPGKKPVTLKAAADLALAFTPDGKTLVAVGRELPLADPRDGNAAKPTGRIGGWGRVATSRWDTATGNKLTTANLLGSAATWPCALSPDGKTLALREKLSFRVEFVDTETGKPRSESGGHAATISALSFSPLGKYLASSDRYGTKLWDLATAREVASWPERPTYRLVFSPDETLLALARGTEVWVHRVPDGKQLHVLDAKVRQPVESIAFSPDGALIAANGGRDTVRVWRVSDGKELRILSYPKTVSCVLFAPDGSRLYAAGASGIGIWETQTGLEVKHLFDGQPIARLEWLADGKTLAAYTPGAVRHIDPETGAERRTISVPQSAERSEHDHLFSPGARFLAAVTTGGVSVTQVGTEPERQRLFRLSPARETSPETAGSAAFSPDGRYLACGNGEGVIGLLRLSRKDTVPELQVLAPTARERAERPNAADGREHEKVPAVARTYLGGGDPKRAPKDVVAVLGDVRFRHSISHAQPIYSGDGKMLAVVGRGGVCIFAATSGALVSRLENTQSMGDGWRAAFSPDNRFLAVWHAGNKVGLYSTGSGRKVRTFDAPAQAAAAAFSPDGKHVVICAGDNRHVFQYEIETGKGGGLVNEQMAGAVDAAFWPGHPDGPVLGILHHDARIDLWKDATGPKRTRWQPHKGIALAMAFRVCPIRGRTT
jgi:WD40 repeat protein